MDWEDWLDKHGAALVLYARQWTESTAAAEDAVQAGFVRFWQSRYREAADPTPLLYTCVRREVCDQIRSRKRRELREQQVYREGGEIATMFESGLEATERAAEIEKAMDGLPAEQREVLALKIWGELTFPQIGQTLEISPNTAASRYRYALEALRKTLKGTTEL